jgi:hypothetical protein
MTFRIICFCAGFILAVGLVACLIESMVRLARRQHEAKDILRRLNDRCPQKEVP